MELVTLMFLKVHVLLQESRKRKINPLKLPEEDIVDYLKAKAFEESNIVYENLNVKERKEIEHQSICNRIMEMKNFGVLGNNQNIQLNVNQFIEIIEMMQEEFPKNIKICVTYSGNNSNYNLFTYLRRPNCKM